MAPYFFGVSRKRITRKQAMQIEKICKEEGADFTEINIKEGSCPGINNGLYQSRIECHNRGAPFDRETEIRVLGRVAKEVR